MWYWNILPDLYKHASGSYEFSLEMLYNLIYFYKGTISLNAELKPTLWKVLMSVWLIGIWTADLKKRTNLQQPQVNKALKNLESRSLVKAVKTVTV